MLNASDCAVMSLRKNALFHHGISPNKLFDYSLFAPRSVIACEQKTLAGLEHLVSSRCEPDDPAALAKTLVSALRAPERPLDERIAVAKRYSYSVLAARYLAQEPRLPLKCPIERTEDRSGSVISDADALNTLANLMPCAVHGVNKLT
jgi:hypothetical protein